MSNNATDSIVERTLAANVKLYYDTFIPQDARQPRPLLIALHGYGGSKRQMMREARVIAPDDFAIVSLQGFHQHIREPREAGAPLKFGFGWVTNFKPEESVALHHYAVNSAIDTLTREGVADAARVFLLGFSQSVGINYRYAFTHAGRLRGVIAICGGMPGDWETGEQYRETDASVLHLLGARDEFYTPERTVNYAADLRQRARDVEVKSYDDAAHEITDGMREDARQWLTARARG